MGAILAFSINSAIYLTMMYLGFKWILADENRPRLNRILLLAICVLSLIIPALPQLENGSVTALSENIAIGDIHITQAETTAVTEWEILSVIIIIYITGAAVCLIRMITDMVILRRIISSGERIECEYGTIIVTEDLTVSPFSWMNYIVLNRQDYESNRHIMLLHESCHTCHRHWLDILVAQLTAIYQWYNPAAWLLRNELKTVHEYQADSCVLSAGVEPREYQMLLIKKAVGTRFPSLANSLNHSKLKKRVTMMYKSKSSTAGFRALVIVPALVAGWLISNVPAVASVTDSLSNAVFSDKNTENFANPQESTQDEKKDVFSAVDKMPQYPGGIEALMKYMMENIKYPAEAAEQKIQGRVIVRFIVTKEGKVESPEVLRKANPLLEAEAIRMIKSLPDFIPGEVKGKKVNVFYTLPVTFKLPPQKQ